MTAKTRPHTPRPQHINTGGAWLLLLASLRYSLVHLRESKTDGLRPRFGWTNTLEPFIRAVKVVRQFLPVREVVGR